MLVFFKEKKLFFTGIFTAFIVAILDLISKKEIFEMLENRAVNGLFSDSQIEITSFFNLVHVWNRGVSFGMFNNLPNSWIIFSTIQFLIAAALLVWLFKNEKIHFSYALGLILGGAFGNLIDRILHGAVADFLDFHIFTYHWPAFNLADSAVFIGVMILCFDEIFFNKKS